MVNMESECGKNIAFFAIMTHNGIIGRLHVAYGLGPAGDGSGGFATKARPPAK